MIFYGMVFYGMAWYLHSTVVESRPVESLCARSTINVQNARARLDSDSDSESESEPENQNRVGVFVPLLLQRACMHDFRTTAAAAAHTYKQTNHRHDVSGPWAQVVSGAGSLFRQTLCVMCVTSPSLTRRRRIENTPIFLLRIVQ